MRIHRLCDRAAPTVVHFRDIEAIAQRIDGFPRIPEPVGDRWVPEPVDWVGARPAEQWTVLPFDGAMLALSASGVERFGAPLRPCGELLPARLAAEPIHIFRCFTWLSPFDEERCVYEFGYDEGPFLSMRHVAFLTEGVPEQRLFRLAKYDSYSLYLAARQEPEPKFRELADAMPGASWELVWDDECESL